MYRLVVIGEQTMMAENLNHQIIFERESKNISSYCFDNLLDNCEKYGSLYDWNTAVEICPEGWHLPSNDEWLVLESYIRKNSDGYIGKHLMSVNAWDNYADIDDIYGFNFLPVGTGVHINDYVYFNNTEFQSACFWSSTEFSESRAYSPCIDYEYGFSYYNHSFEENDFDIEKENINSNEKFVLLSVRCFHD